MNIRNLAVLGGLAAGAALTFAPLASADTPIDPSIISTEIGSLNSLFDTYAALAGDSADITHHVGSFDTILPADAPVSGTPTLLDYELYGLNPIAAGPATDPGSYNVFNGALTEFYDAYNVELYALANNGDLISGAAASSDLFGSAHEIATALATDSVSGAAGDFFNAGLADLGGFL